MCLLDDEETVVEGTMRATGDWVQVHDFPFVFPGQEGSTHKTLWSAGTPRCLAAGR